MQRFKGADIVNRSIAYHDPQRTWGKGPVEFRLFESRPGNSPDEGGNYRITDLSFDLSADIFVMDQQRGPDHIFRKFVGDECTIELNSSADLTEKQIEAFGLSCDLGTRLKDYYIYLWGLPMKLKDPGTNISEEVHLADFFGQELVQVRVTYDVDVGSDTWYFYFDPRSYALKGYRFYHDEAGNDGEYILLEGEATLGTLKVPQARMWYTHQEGRFLGEDRIIFN